MVTTETSDERIDLRARLAESEARVRELEAAARALVGKSPFFISIGVPDWYCCQFCLRTETTEGLHGDGCEFAALDAALRGAEG